MQTLLNDACRAAAFDYLCDNIGSANLESLAAASKSDIDFLSDILNDPVYAELIQVSYSCDWSLPMCHADYVRTLLNQSRIFPCCYASEACTLDGQSLAGYHR